MPPHIFIVAPAAWGVYAAIRWFRRRWPGDSVSFVVDFAGSVLIGAGFAAPVPLAGFVQWMYTAPRGYGWVISGPSPFGSFGSGPYMMALLTGCFLLGCGIVAVGLLLRGMALGRVAGGKGPGDRV